MLSKYLAGGRDYGRQAQKKNVVVVVGIDAKRRPQHSEYADSSTVNAVDQPDEVVSPKTEESLVRALPCGTPMKGVFS